MIRLAFVAVLAVAGLLAFMGFSLVRNTGDAPQAEGAQTPPPADEVLAEEAAPLPTQAPFLQDIDLASGMLALVLYRAGPDATDLVIIDQAALQAAQGMATLTTDAGTSDQAATPRDQRIAALYRDDTLVTVFTCPATGCPSLADPDSANLAGLLDAAQPLPLLEDIYDDYTQYLDALAFIAADPNFALLDRAAAHPLPQQTPTATLILPTISRSADNLLDLDTHAALLKALLADSLPQGVSVQTLTITPMGNPIVVDADNGRPATRGGAEFPYTPAVLYHVEVQIAGAADLDADTLAAMTDQTRMQIDWQENGAEYIASLGLECTDCFEVRAKGETYDSATVTDITPETYSLIYYDLREAP